MYHDIKLLFDIIFISKYKVHHFDVRYKIIIDVTRWKYEVGWSIIKICMIM